MVVGIRVHRLKGACKCAMHERVRAHQPAGIRTHAELQVTKAQAQSKKSESWTSSSSLLSAAQVVYPRS